MDREARDLVVIFKSFKAGSGTVSTHPASSYPASYQAAASGGFTSALDRRGFPESYSQSKSEAHGLHPAPWNWGVGSRTTCISPLGLFSLKEVPCTVANETLGGLKKDAQATSEGRDTGRYKSNAVCFFKFNLKS